MGRQTRRWVLRTAGLAAAAGLAGCGDGGNDVVDGSIPGDDHPAIDRWLSGATVGAPTDNYGGMLVDARDRSTVRIDVGAPGNGGAFAYGPPGVVVSAGTTVEWAWTGEGNPHNVEAQPDAQLGESDYAFSSGRAEGGEGVKFTFAFDEPGIALYHCQPHLSLGMKGAVAVA